MRAVVLAAAAALYGGAAGCGPNTGGLCDAVRDCIGGNDADREACVIRLDTFADNAASQGCSSEFVDAFDCYEESATCSDAVSGFGCSSDDDCQFLGGACVNNECRAKVYGLEDQACEAELNALNSCSAFQIGGFF